MNIQKLKEEIEDMRQELTAEFEKCIEKDGIDLKVLELSQKLDKLILEYLKKDKPE